MKFNALLVSAAMMVMTLAACGDDDPVNPDNNQGGNEDTETVEGMSRGFGKPIPSYWYQAISQYRPVNPDNRGRCAGYL